MADDRIGRLALKFKAHLAFRNTVTRHTIDIHLRHYRGAKIAGPALIPADSATDLPPHRYLIDIGLRTLTIHDSAATRPIACL